MSTRPSNPERRRFLIASCGAAFSSAAAGLLLSGCGRSSEHDVASTDRTTTITIPPAEPTPIPGFAPPSAEPWVRVRVARLRESRRRPIANLVGEKGQWLRIHSPLVHKYGDMARGPVSIVQAPNDDAVTWIIEDRDGQEIRLPGAAHVDIHVLDDQPDSTIALSRTRYPGFLRFVPEADERRTGVDVVNVVAMEDYLPGVLARELYAHWRPATFEAQAVAARSFALHETLHFRNTRSFDVTNTQQSQAYIGETDRRRAIDAVAATRGRVLTWNSERGPRVVPGYYSSCCGGRAAPAADVIGPNPINAIPPLFGHLHDCPCKDAPRYRWSLSMSVNSVARQVRRWAEATGQPAFEGICEPEEIAVIESARTGRPRRLVWRCAAGTSVEMDATCLCDALRYRDERDSGRGSKVWSPFLQPRGIADGTVRFEGCGYGHGAGLCQYGAEAHARAGTDAGSILAWYYPGADIVRAWDGSTAG